MSFIEKCKKTSIRASGEIVARLIVDTNKKEVLFVPAEINHPEYLEIYLGKKMAELKSNPNIVSPYVGAALKIIDNKVVEVLVGISGLETVFSRYKKPLHTKEQVSLARDIILANLQAEKLLVPNFRLRYVAL